jgi:hypothetical protein
MVIFPLYNLPMSTLQATSGSIKEKKEVDDTAERLAYCPSLSTHVIWFQAKGISPESYNSRSISNLTTTEDMSVNCAAF